MKTHGKVTRLTVALAAIAVSGIALADHNPGHSKQKEDKDPPGPPASKFGVKLQNLCVPALDSKQLIIKSTITNTTSGITDPVEVSQIRVEGLQLVPSPLNPKKKVWVTVGSVHTNSNPAISIDQGDSTDYVWPIDLCTDTSIALRHDAKALNVEVQVMVDGRNFVANCDDPDPDDGIDQAKVSLVDYPGLACQ